MKKLMSLVFLLVLVAVVTACSGSGDGSGSGSGDDTDTTAASQETTAEITIADFTYSGPDTVAVGTTVTVTNEDTVEHTWTARDGSFDSGTIAQGSFDFTFEEAGEFDFFCSIHPQMEGSITVEG